MKTRNISEKDIKVMRRLLGDDIVREFLEFLRLKREEERRVAVGANVKEREYVVNVSKFSERDLRGFLDWDESYIDDEYFWKPEWFEKLERLCEVNDRSRYVVVFKGIENASDTVYMALKRFKETGKIFDEDYPCKLPSNARFGEVVLPERIIKERRNNNRTNEEKDEDEGSGSGCGWFDYNEYDVLR